MLHDVRVRVDAQRNRDRILEAARALVAETGVDATMEDIARHAGVAVGTLYRHFPAKEELLEALLLERVAQIEHELRAALAEEATPWDALARFLRTVAGLQLADRSLHEFLTGTVGGREAVRERRRALFRLAGDLIERAQASGELRGDVSTGDLPLLLGSVGRAAWAGAPSAETLLDRYVAVILDGLRAPGATPLPGRAPGFDEVDRGFR